MRTPLAILLFFLATAGAVTGQEICDNGRDDDGDGLTDLQDSTDCACNLLPAVPSLLPNPSFESFSPDERGCNSTQPGGLPDAQGQVDCLTGWVRASDGTTDSWNAFTYSGNPPFWPGALPQPLPSGSSVAGFWTGVLRPDDYSSDGRQLTFLREYLGACLADGGGLTTGEQYRLTLDIGFVRESFFAVGDPPIPPQDSGRISSPRRAELALYGIRDCNNIRFPGRSCVELSPGTGSWEKITNFTVAGDPGTWTGARIDFSPDFPYQALAIGADCSPNPRENRREWRHYYFVDNIRVNTVASFNRPTLGGPITVQGNSVCDDNILLTGPDDAGADYQWYKNGVAITAANERFYRIPTGPDIDGRYQLRTSIDGGCVVSEPVIVQQPVIPENVIRDSFLLCRVGDPITIQSANDFAARYTWSDGSTGRFFRVDSPGTYAVTITTPCERRIERYAVVLNGRLNYQVETDVGGCFTPGQSVALNVNSNWSTGFMVAYAVLPQGGERNLGTFRYTTVLDSVPSADLYVVVFAGCGRIDTLRIDLLRDIDFEADVPVLDCRTGAEEIQITVTTNLDVSHQWFGPDGLRIPGATNLALPVSTPGLYRLDTRLSDDCVTTNTYRVDEIIDPPDIQLLSDGVVCADGGGTIRLTTDIEGPLSYTWEDPFGAVIPGAVGPELRVREGGSYTATVSYGANCSETRSLDVALADIDAVILADIPELTCASPTGELRATPRGSDFPTYQWLDSLGGAISGADGRTLSVTAPGDYLLRVTYPAGCSRIERFSVPFTDDFGVAITTDGAVCEDRHTLTALPERGSPPYAYRWFSGEGGSEIGVTASLADQLSGAYQVEVSDATGCAAEQRVVVDRVDFLRLLAVRPLAECDSDGGVLTALVNGGTEPISYGLAGEAATANPDIAVASAGNYVVEVTDSNGCTVISEPVELAVPADFEVYAGEDRVIGLGEAARLRAVVSPPDLPGLDVSWSSSGAFPICADCPDPDVRPLRATTYTLTAISTDGCQRSDEVTIDVDSRPAIYFPNAFSPNGDGRNDRFLPFPGRGVDRVLSFRVFDRWGGLVFKAATDNPGWDGSSRGRDAAAGVYTYVAAVRLLNADVAEYRGTVQLLR